MNSRRLLFVSISLTAALLAGGCATSSSSGRAYSSSQTRGEQTVRLGVVDSVRQVNIEGSKSPVGVIAGGAIGGIAGSNVGGRRGSTIGTVLGAIAGGMAGNAIESKITEKQGIEITVRLENGELRAITQEADEEFRPGQRVRLLSSGGTTRVTH